MKGVFDEAGLGHLCGDPEALRAFLGRMARLEEVLKGLGLEHLLDDPDELKRLLEAI